MDYNCCGSALAGGFLVLVGPTTVIGHGFAIEEFRVARGKPWVIDQHDDRLARIILTGIIVPVIFRRDRAIADKHDVRWIEREFIRVLALGPEDHVFLGRHWQFSAIGRSQLEE